MTLTHLIKLFKDGLLSVPYRIQNIVPEEMKPEKLRFKIKRDMATFKAGRIRIIAMTLFKRLDLGNPIVPDLRVILDNHLKELCLPSDLKPLVLSLMDYKPCSFLDVNSNDRIIYKVPAYEFHIMTYILWALKLCLGLDCDYEVKLSKAAEVINENEGRTKSYLFNGVSEPTDRLFSFCEWVTFYQFRQIVLRHYCYRYANKCSWDTDDYIALEHHMDFLQDEWGKDLKDEMTYDILNRIKGGLVESNVIPRGEFEPTLTPFHSYSQVIAQHLQDPEVKLQLTEDFTQYSLKYVIEDWNLFDPNSTTKSNLVKGINVSNKVVTKKVATFAKPTVYSQKMVYVRNCDNHNWLTTKPPSIEHVVNVDTLDQSDDDGLNEQNINITQNGIEKSDNKMPDSQVGENQDGAGSNSHSISEISITNSTIPNSIQFINETNIFNSNNRKRKINDSITSISKFPDTVNENSFNNSSLSNGIQLIDETKDFESTKLDKMEKDKLNEMNDRISNPYEIKEETEGVNIFDDDFKPEIKNELNEHNDCGIDYENTLNVLDNFQDVSCNQSQVHRDEDNDSVGSSLDSVNFNEGTFDRAKTIKEIILYACKKHKLPIPPEYNPKVHHKKEMGLFSRKIDCITNKKVPTDRKRNITHEKQRRGIWQSYVTDYHTAMQDDLLNQIEQKLTMAIQNIENAQKANEENTPLEETIGDNTNMEVDAISNHNETNMNQSELASDTENQIRYESDKDKLFSEESDGETHAKELLPEKNPDFDEELYDASQLYVKVTKNDEDGEMELDPQLSAIIDKKMLKDAKDPSLLTWTEERKQLARPDSEDEMPLSVLQELKELRNKLSEQENERLDPFVREKVENFKYWFRFYSFATHNTVLSRVFEKEVCDELPKSFSFVLRQCAHIVGVSEGDLYMNLQRFEMTSVEKSRIKLKRFHFHLNKQF